MGGSGGREKQELLRSKAGGLVALRVSSGTQLALEGRVVCTPGDRGECCQAEGEDEEAAGDGGAGKDERGRGLSVSFRRAKDVSGLEVLLAGHVPIPIPAPC